MRKLALLTLALTVLPTARSVDRIDFSKADKNTSEQPTSSDENYMSSLSLDDLVEIGKIQEHKFYPFVANVQKASENQPRFSNINKPLYLKSIAVSALIRNHVGKKARHEVRDLTTHEIVGEYEANIGFNPMILGKEYSPAKLDITNRDYEVIWTVGKQNDFREIGRMLFGKHGTRISVR